MRTSEMPNLSERFGIDVAMAIADAYAAALESNVISYDDRFALVRALIAEAERGRTSSLDFLDTAVLFADSRTVGSLDGGDAWLAPAIPVDQCHRDGRSKIGAIGRPSPAAIKCQGVAVAAES